MCLTGVSLLVPPVFFTLIGSIPVVLYLILYHKLSQITRELRSMKELLEEMNNKGTNS
ncbi:hypothetical protein CEB3_c39520 [Peptococcaceae bacterium CEB3]|nr:hypothetical protein CEB3_c39520 [Peptococcaceae bacterium CEB3]